MAALTAASVTVVVTEQIISGRKRRVRGTIAFGDGTDTYPTSGVPLPAISVFGFKRQMDTFHIFGSNERTTSYLARFGPASNTILLYEEEATAAGGPLLEADTSEAPVATTYNFEASGW